MKRARARLGGAYPWLRFYTAPYAPAIWALD